MKKAFTTAIAISAVLAWNVALAQSSAPKAPVQKAPAKVAQAKSGSAAAGQSGETTGTVLGSGGGALGTGLSAGALTALGVVTLSAIAVSNQNDTLPPTGTR